jgi:hypothetical protein
VCMDVTELLLAGTSDPPFLPENLRHRRRRHRALQGGGDGLLFMIDNLVESDQAGDRFYTRFDPQGREPILTLEFLGSNETMAPTGSPTGTLEPSVEVTGNSTGTFEPSVEDTSNSTGSLEPTMMGSMDGSTGSPAPSDGTVGNWTGSMEPTMGGTGNSTYAPCSICGEGSRVGNGTGIIIIPEGLEPPGFPNEISCEEAEAYCDSGFCDEQICEQVPIAANTYCACEIEL